MMNYVKGTYKTLNFIDKSMRFSGRNLDFTIDFLKNLKDIRDKLLKEIFVNKNKLIPYLPNHFAFIETIIPKNENNISYNTNSLVIKGYNYDRSYLDDNKVKHELINYLINLFQDKELTREIKEETTLKDIKRLLYKINYTFN